MAPTKGMFDVLDDAPERHDLAHAFRFHFLQNATDEDGFIENRTDDDLHSTGSFNTVEDFWNIYSHLTRPNDLPAEVDCCLFRDGVLPFSEDPANSGGGKWTVRLSKGLASHLWEETVLAIIGGNFNLDEDINGAVLSRRQDYDVLSLWCSHKDRERTLRVREALVLVLNAPQTTIVEFKRYPCTDSRSASAPAMKYDAPTLLAYKQHCKEPPLYVWESLEAAGELRWLAAGGGGARRDNTANDDDGGEFEVIGNRGGRREKDGGDFWEGGGGGGGGGFVGMGRGRGRGRGRGGGYIGGGGGAGPGPESLWD